MATDPTARETLASYILDRPVGEFIAEHHADSRSDRWIAQALAERTDGAVSVTRETVRKWRLRHNDAEALAGDAA